MKRFILSWDSVLAVAMMAVASICAQSAGQVLAQEQEEGKVVTISPDAGVAELEGEVQVVDASAYWIGIRGRNVESEVLRTQLQLAEDMGVVVEEVIKDSPADKAGLRRFDIVLRVNGDVVNNMQVLQDHVRDSKDKPLELTIIRLSKQEKLVVTPEARPEQVVQDSLLPGGRMQLGGRFEDNDMLRQLMQGFGGRNIGPGVVLRGGQALNLNQMPNGVSVAIQRQDDGPAQISVQKDGKTWTIQGDDEEALKQLPDDVRPFVQRMLNGQGQVFGFDGAFDLGDLDVQIEQALPRDLKQLLPGGEGILRNFEAGEADLKKKMEEIEKSIQQLRELMERQKAEIPLEKTS